MKKLIVELPDELHGRLKRRAAADSKTIKATVTRLISGYVAQGEKQERQKETGFRGAWQDERSAADIAADIRKHRRWFAKDRRPGA